MAVWKQNVVLMLVCVSYISIGNGRIIVNTTEGIKSTTFSSNSSQTTLSEDTSKVPINGSISTTVEITSVLINATKSDTTTMLINDSGIKDTSILMNNRTRENNTMQKNSTADIYETTTVFVNETKHKLMSSPKVSINGTFSTSVKEITSVLVNATNSNTTTVLINDSGIKNTTLLMNDRTSENTTMQMNSTTDIYETTTVFASETKHKLMSSPANRTDVSQNIHISDISGSKLLDLAFIMDTTGSMGSYINSARHNIRNLVNEISVNSNTDLRVALIEYRDHPPEENSFVTRTNDFIKYVKTMKTWLDKANARGGGDGPEAVAEGLFDVTKLSWRQNAAKITVLISDAPPHGLVPWEDMSFKEGSPNGHDPMKIAQDLAKREIIVYAVGCEPSINPYKDFFMALAYMTGGQYIPLSDPAGLIQAIVGGAREELSLQKFSKVVEQEINRITASGAAVDEESIAKYVYKKLQQQGATSQRLLRNNKPLEGASKLAKTFAASSTMDDVRMAYASEHPAPSYYHHGPISTSGGRYASEIDDMGYEMMEPMEGFYYSDYMHEPLSLSYDDVGDYGPLYSSPVDPSIGASHSSPSRTDTGESYSTVDSAISYEQIARLVRKKTAKLTTP